MNYLIKCEAKSLEMQLFSSMESQLCVFKDVPDLSLFTSSSDRKVYDISDRRNVRLTSFSDIIKICDRKLRRCIQIVKIIIEDKTSIFHDLQSLHIPNCSIEHANGLGNI